MLKIKFPYFLGKYCSRFKDRVKIRLGFPLTVPVYAYCFSLIIAIILQSQKIFGMSGKLYSRPVYRLSTKSGMI